MAAVEFQLLTIFTVSRHGTVRIDRIGIKASF